MLKRTRILLLAVLLGFSFSTRVALVRAQEPNTDAMRYRYIGPVGNRVTSVAGVPGQPYIYYAGAASGGIFKTVDGASIGKQSSTANRCHRLVLWRWPRPIQTLSGRARAKPGFAAIFP